MMPLPQPAAAFASPRWFENETQSAITIIE
jgi:hypothetical protein